MAARAQHPVQLVAGARGVEPVEGLGDGHGVRRAGGEWEQFGPGGDEAGAGRVPGELGAHARHRFDGHDPGAGPDEESGELAGAGGHVDDGGSRPEAELIGEDVDGGVGVAGTAQLVASALRFGEPRSRV
jgi:hypothetical protein